MKKTSFLMAVSFVVGCAGESLPADYTIPADCLSVHEEPIPPTEDDPHDGYKYVYFCGVEASELVDEKGVPQLPYPEGTLVIKESTTEGQDYPWLIAQMEKVNGSWQWVEYTRNFADEEFVAISVSESVCTDCHKKAKASDWVFSVYTGP